MKFILLFVLFFSANAFSLSSIADLKKVPLSVKSLVSVSNNLNTNATGGVIVNVEGGWAALKQEAATGGVIVDVEGGWAALKQDATTGGVILIPNVTILFTDISV